MFYKFRLLLFLYFLNFTIISYGSEDDILQEYLSMDGVTQLTQIQAKEIIEKIDWEKAEKISLTFEDNAYFPETLTLDIGKPYRLKLVNKGNRSHDLAGEKFLSSIIIKKIDSADYKIKAYHVESIYLRPKKEIDVWLVPVKKGEFYSVCTLPGHLDDGMEGVVIIQ